MIRFGSLALVTGLLLVPFPGDGGGPGASTPRPVAVERERAAGQDEPDGPRAALESRAGGGRPSGDAPLSETEQSSGDAPLSEAERPSGDSPLPAAEQPSGDSPLPAAERPTGSTPLSEAAQRPGEAPPPGRRRHAGTAAAAPPVLYPLFLRPLPGEPALPRPSRRAPRELLLTFDDGPDLHGTPAVLAELGRRGLKAIFFVNGEHMVGRRPEDFVRKELIRRIAAEGHLVANHTLSHRNVCAEQAEVMEHEIDGNAEIIAAATGVRPPLFRAPYGARCRRLDQALQVRDVLQVGWNLDPQDWKGGTEDAVVEYVTGHLARIGGRAILLLHDTRREAVGALPRILDWIDRENARLVRAGEPPIRLRDYSVFLPPVPLPDTGLEPVLAPLLADLTRPWHALTASFSAP